MAKTSWHVLTLVDTLMQTGKSDTAWFREKLAQYCMLAWAGSHLFMKEMELKVLKKLD